MVGGEGLTSPMLIQSVSIMLQWSCLSPLIWMPVINSAAKMGGMAQTPIAQVHALVRFCEGEMMKPYGEGIVSV